MINMKMESGGMMVTVDCKVGNPDYHVNNREFLIALDKLVKCVELYDSVRIAIYTNDASSDSIEESDYDHDYDQEKWDYDEA